MTSSIRSATHEQYDFRHQLLRDALYRSVPAGERRRYHARAAEFGGLLEGASAIHASVHFERAGMSEEAFRTALAGRSRPWHVVPSGGLRAVRRAVDNLPASISRRREARRSCSCSRMRPATFSIAMP